MHNSYVYDPKHINADKLREEATMRRLGQSWRGNKPESTVIHYHLAGELCKGREHEFILIDEDALPNLDALTEPIYKPKATTNGVEVSCPVCDWGCSAFDINPDARSVIDNSLLAYSSFCDHLREVHGAKHPSELPSPEEV